MAQYSINNLPAPIHFEIGNDIVLRTLQNAKNLLMTKMGDVPFDRYRGFNTALYDMPLPELREALIRELDRIMMWEPDVEVVDADCELDAGGSVIILVTLEINIDE